MLAGDFQRKLRKLNPNIRIFCSNDDSKPAGIYIVIRGEYKEICGIDKNYLPEHIQYDENGRIVKGGWRRAIKTLIKKGFIDKKKAESVFSTHLNYSAPKFKYHSPDISKKLINKGIPVEEVTNGCF